MNTVADFCDCLEEWENEVYKWCEFQKESFKTAICVIIRCNILLIPAIFRHSKRYMDFLGGMQF